MSTKEKKITNKKPVLASKVKPKPREKSTDMKLISTKGKSDEEIKKDVHEVLDELLGPEE